MTRRRTASPLLAAVTALLATVSLSGCGGGSGARTGGTPEPAQSAPAVALAALPKPVGATVLTISGTTSVKNVGATLALDEAQVEALPTVTLTTYEPFEKRDSTFTGVSLGALFARVGVDPAAKTVAFHALDDYEVTLAVKDLVSQGAVLATRENGQPMPIKAGGPIRVVFPTSSKVGKNSDLWIWSVDRMAFR